MTASQAHLKLLFDPRSLGCRCDECPLRKDDGEAWTPVPPEIRANARLLIIGEAPAKYEIKEGKPFAGPSGWELDRLLRLHGQQREHVSITNVLLCRVPAKSIDAMNRRLSRANEKRELAGEPPVPHPIECCRPHLDAEVAGSRALLVLGKTAYSTLSGERAGEDRFFTQRGFPTEIAGKPAVVTWHPAHVLRNRRWTDVLQADVGKAFRHAGGRLSWTAPTLLFNPTLGQLDGALDQLSRSPLVAADSETEPAPLRKFDCEHDLLRCVALGTPAFGVSLGWKSVPKQAVPTVWKVPPPAAAERIRNFFADLDRRGSPVLVMHNGGVYDRPVLERYGIPMPRNVLDTLPLARAAWSELGHKLDFLASWYTDAPKHKTEDHAAWESDEELARYCSLDCAVDAVIAPLLVEKVRRTDQGRAYLSDARMQEFAVGAHRAGMAIDPVERARHDARLVRAIVVAEAGARAATDESRLWRRAKPINLASVPQVREYLYDNLALPWQTKEEDDEDPTTQRDALYALLQVAGLPDHARRFIEALSDYRAAARSLSKDVRGLPVDPLTGRVHPHWGTMGVTGRPQSTDPNVSNVAATKRDLDSLRSMYVAEPGCVLVAADKDAAELRGVTLLAGDAVWGDLFRRKDAGEAGLDLHKINASGMFFTHKMVAEILPFERDYAKALIYLNLYGGGARRAMLNMRQVRDPRTGLRPYATMTLKRAREARSNVLRVHPALERWWNATVEDWRAHRFLREPILGRCRYFLDGEAGRDDEAEERRSELINFRVQALIASQVGGSTAVGALMDEIGWPWSGRLRGLGGRGIIHHGYDSLMVEVAESNVERAKAVLESAMTCDVSHQGRTLRFPAKAKAGRRWSELV